MTWQDLADDELEQRLVQKGMPSNHAYVCVMRRDEGDIINFINEWWENNDG